MERAPRAIDEVKGSKQLFKRPGGFDDLADYLRFDAASKAALVWFKHFGHGGVSKAATVADACSR